MTNPDPFPERLIRLLGEHRGDHVDPDARAQIAQATGYWRNAIYTPALLDEAARLLGDLNTYLTAAYAVTPRIRQAMSRDGGGLPFQCLQLISSQRLHDSSSLRFTEHELARLLHQAVRAAEEELATALPLTEAFAYVPTIPRGCVVVKPLPQTPRWFPGAPEDMGLVLTLERGDLTTDPPWEWHLFPDRKGGTEQVRVIMGHCPTAPVAREVGAIVAQILTGKIKL